tara:strand:+ start:324 stop:632 length:309 start_codon:yes stop_codon:yes gene_type:complete
MWRVAFSRSTSLASSPVISAKRAPVSVRSIRRLLATSLLGKAGTMMPSCSSVIGSRSVLLLPAPLIIDDWIEFYNSERPHTALDKRTPDIAYFGHAEVRKAA